MRRCLGMAGAPAAWNLGMAAAGAGVLALLGTAFVAAITRGPCSELCLDDLLWVFVLALWGVALALGTATAVVAYRPRQDRRRT